MNNPIELKLYDAYCPAVQDWLDTFDINTVPNYMRNRLWKSYESDFLLTHYDYEDGMTAKQIIKESRELYENTKKPRRVYAVKDVIRNITGVIGDLKEEQFRTVSHNGIDSLWIKDVPNFWIQPVYGYIPDADDLNIHVIDSKMLTYGYVRVRTSEQYEKRNERKWWLLVYQPDPKYMPDVRHMITQANLLHFSPEKYHDDIREEGLIPSRGGRTYLYPNERIFFYVRNNVNPLEDAFMDMMRGIYRKEKRKDPMMSNIYDCWRLLMKKVPQSAKVYYDPNEDECIYLTIHIEPEWLEYMPDWELEL